MIRVLGPAHIPVTLLVSIISTDITQLTKTSRLYSTEILDPYARATVSRSGPGIALSRKNISRKKQFSPPAIEDAVVVEAHARDLLANASFNLSDSERNLGLLDYLNG